MLIEFIEEKQYLDEKKNILRNIFSKKCLDNFSFHLSRPILAPVPPAYYGMA